MTVDEVRAKIAELAVRYENGIAWLLEHDPTGSFYLWIKSGLTSVSPMPAQSEDRRAEWLAYYKGFRTWESLDARLLALEAQLRTMEAKT